MSNNYLPPITPYDFQKEAIDALFDGFSKVENKGKWPLLVLPTASGKSVINAFILNRIINTWPDQRLLCLTHVKELIGQNLSMAERVMKGRKIGVFSASYGRKDTTESIIFAGIQSIARRPEVLGRFDLVIVDEVHLIPTTNNGQYRTYLNYLKELNPQLMVVGLTATPFRLDSGHLLGQEESVFHYIAYEVKLALMLERGYITPLTTKPVQTYISTRAVKKSSNGDYNLKSLADACNDNNITRAAIEEARLIGRNRKKWMIFCVNVKHADDVAAEVIKQGISARVIHGGTPKKEREKGIEDYKNSKFTALVSVGMFTTGFDEKDIDLLVFLRKTQSLALWIQMLGRGMRVGRQNSGKTDCLVLDFAGNIDTHGAVDSINVARGTFDPDIEVIEGEYKIKKPPKKLCPACDFELHLSAKHCPECGYDFPSAITHDVIPSGAAILSTDIAEVLHKDVKIMYSIHKKRGGKDSLRVDYVKGSKIICSEFVCFDHSGFAADLAYKWWLTRALNDKPYPESVKEAHARVLNECYQPETISTKRDGKYNRLVNIYREKNEPVIS